MHTNGEMMVNHGDCVSSRKTRTVASLALAFGWWLDKEMLQPSWSFQTLSGQIKLQFVNLIYMLCNIAFCATPTPTPSIKYVHINTYQTSDHILWASSVTSTIRLNTVWVVPTNEHICLHLYNPLHTYWLVLTQCGLISGFSLCIIFPLFEAEPNDGSASCWWTVTATVWSTSAKRGRCCRRKAGRCKPPSLPRQAPRLGERWEVDGSYAKGASYG